MKRISLRDEFARTYDPPGDRDPVEVRDEYEKFREHIARNPDHGSYAVANALEAPRGRVRAWMENGAMPDVVRGTVEADEYGWFRAEGPTHHLMTGLVAAVFAGGSISEEHYKPTFSTGDADLIESALGNLGAEFRHVMRDEPRSGDELHPAWNASVLGRVLAARGAPVGCRVDEYELPGYLFDRQQTAEVFVEYYLSLRGVNPSGKRHIQIIEQSRSEDYHDDLHRLFGMVLDGPVTRGKNGIRILGEAVEGNEVVRQHF